MTKTGRSADKGEGGDQPVTSRISLAGNKILSDFPLRHSEGKDRQVGWVKGTDKITFTNFIHNFDKIPWREKQLC